MNTGVKVLFSFLCWFSLFGVIDVLLQNK